MSEGKDFEPTITTHPDIISIMGTSLNYCTRCSLRATASLEAFLGEEEGENKEDRKKIALKAINSLSHSISFYKGMILSIESQRDGLVEKMKPFASPNYSPNNEPTLVLCNFVNK